MEITTFAEAIDKIDDITHQITHLQIEKREIDHNLKREIVEAGEFDLLNINYSRVRSIARRINAKLNNR